MLSNLWIWFIWIESNPFRWFGLVSNIRIQWPFTQQYTYHTTKSHIRWVNPKILSPSPPIHPHWLTSLAWTPLLLHCEKVVTYASSFSISHSWSSIQGKGWWTITSYHYRHCLVVCLVYALLCITNCHRLCQTRCHKPPHRPPIPSHHIHMLGVKHHRASYINTICSLGWLL